MELGKRIRQLRFRAGLTQEQLAEKLGVGAQAVSKWENAVAMPDISLLPLLAEIFAKETRRPRFQDELQGIAVIYEVMEEYQKAAETYDRIIDLLENEWGLTEEVALKTARKEKQRLLARAQ